MKKLFLCLFTLLPAYLFAQFGLNAGYNYANITKASSINNSSRSGFNVGGFFAPQSKSIIGSRTELVFSRQGYNYKTSTNTGNVNLDYLMLPQFMSISIGRHFQIHLGGQMAILLNAKVDSSGGSGSGSSVMDYYNRIDYGYGGGVEVRPVQGLILGARFNVSLGDLYKQPEPGETPSFIPEVDVKNNVLMIYAGWKFGK